MKLTPTSLLQKIAIIRSYTLAAAASEFGPQGSNLPDQTYVLEPFADARLVAPGMVLFRPEPGHGEHLLDLPLYLYVEGARLFGGNILLNSREAGKMEGIGWFYLRLDLHGLNMQVNRIAANTAIGEVAHETERHNHLPESLDKSWAGTASGRNTQTRSDVITAALYQFDAFADATDLRSHLTRDEYAATLWLLLALADARHAKRLASHPQAAE